jgi:ubiquinone biosynthesis protein UbiJ
VDTELLLQTYVGVIAQDIQAVVPETVTSHKGKINEDDTDETDILDVDSHSLTFILINAVKELSAQVDSLNRQIADLNARVK